jgi:dihydroxyacetone kinase phosphoprotein-dependent L subunit
VINSLLIQEAVMAQVKGRKMAERIIAAIEENKAWLSEIDGAVGDGDHGINMAKGLSQVKAKLDTVPDNTSEALNFVGMSLMNNIGGAMGPIYGTFFMRMAKPIKGKEEVEKQDLLSMLKGALEGVKQRGKAEPGDKTLVDTLNAAHQEYAKALDQGCDFSDAVDTMIKSAKEGMEATEDMVAKKGRSSRLGERSRGTIDAGAASCYLILKAIGDSLKGSL